ncbi:MAG: F0F1 ATP synthase subunit delta, partial [Chloroflexi bacterium]|nr:F0F1 ATP synthase subunit delta [Chloroflexota bacterium]
MSRPTTAGRRYAEAAFQLAIRDDALDGWAAGLTLAAQFAADAGVLHVVDNPSVPHADRQAMTERLLEGRVPVGVLNLARLLTQRGRFGALPARPNHPPEAGRSGPQAPETENHMAIRSDEIISIIKSAIDTFDQGTETRSVGTVVEVGDGIAQVYGLAGALSSELLEFPNGVRGMALNLEEETVGAVILGDARAIKEGDIVKTTGRVVEVPVGQALLGRVVDPLGRPIDDKGPIETKSTRPVERIAPGV